MRINLPGMGEVEVTPVYTDDRFQTSIGDVDGRCWLYPHRDRTATGWWMEPGMSWYDGQGRTWEATAYGWTL